MTRAKTIRKLFTLPILSALIVIGTSAMNCWAWGGGKTIAPVTGIYRCGMKGNLSGWIPISAGNALGGQPDENGFFRGEHEVAFSDLGICFLSMPKISRTSCYQLVSGVESLYYYKGMPGFYERAIKSMLFDPEQELLQTTWRCETRGKGGKKDPHPKPFADGKPVLFGLKDVLALRKEKTGPSPLTLPNILPQHVDALQKALVPTVATGITAAMLLSTLKSIGQAVLQNATNACGLLFVVPMTPMMNQPILSVNCPLF